MTIYAPVIDGDWIEPKPQQGHKMACCDCGLVHTMNFRVRRGKVQFQAFRDNRATGQRRRSGRLLHKRPRKRTDVGVARKG